MKLKNEVGKRIANNRQFRDPNRNRRLSVDEKHVIVWGWSRGWSASRIGHAIQKNPSSIWYFQARVLRSSALIFHELSLYIQMDGHKFKCRICGEIRTTRTKVMRHIPPHFLPDDIARTAALNIVERPL